MPRGKKVDSESRCLAMAVQSERVFPSEWLFDSVKYNFFPRALSCSSSQARGDPREILNAAPAMMLHGVEGRGRAAPRSFSGVSPSSGKRRDSRTDRQRRALRLQRKAARGFARPRARRCLCRLPQYQCELVAARSARRCQSPGNDCAEFAGCAPTHGCRSDARIDR